MLQERRQYTKYLIENNQLEKFKEINDKLIENRFSFNFFIKNKLWFKRKRLADKIKDFYEFNGFECSIIRIIRNDNNLNLSFVRLI